MVLRTNRYKPKLFFTRYKLCFGNITNFKLEKNLNKRSLIYKYYKKKLVNTGVTLYEIPKGVISLIICFQHILNLKI